MEWFWAAIQTREFALGLAFGGAGTYAIVLFHDYKAFCRDIDREDARLAREDAIDRAEDFRSRHSADPSRR